MRALVCVVDGMGFAETPTDVDTLRTHSSFHIGVFFLFQIRIQSNIRTKAKQNGKCKKSETYTNKTLARLSEKMEKQKRKFVRNA